MTFLLRGELANACYIDNWPVRVIPSDGLRHSLLVCKTVEPLFELVGGPLNTFLKGTFEMTGKCFASLGIFPCVL